jgi:hypothetical protein
MKWKIPPIIKIYEAFGAIADGRIKVDGNNATVESSSGNKNYTVIYKPESSAISANDNGSYWQGYLGYPTIAYLISVGIITCEAELMNLLAGIAWKDVNLELKNDYQKVVNSVLDKIEAEHGLESATKVRAEAEYVLAQIKELGLTKFKTGLKPPVGS